MKDKKRSSKTVDIVSYALKVSENGVHFMSSDTFNSLSTGLTVNTHVSTKTRVTRNNFILHKALQVTIISKINFGYQTRS